MDKKKTWQQVDEIIKVLNAGCRYLDFPLDKDLKDYIVEASQGQVENSSSLAQSPGPGKLFSPIKTAEATNQEGIKGQNSPSKKVETGLDNIAEENENSVSGQGTN